MMKLLPTSLLMLVAVCFAGSQAADCFYRVSSTPAGSNGTMTSCGSSYPYCYSYTSGSGPVAGCSTYSTPCSTSSYPDCVVCSTNYCNSFSPSSISCYSRWGSENSSNNRTITACSTGVSSCYSAAARRKTIVISAGCGECSAQDIGYCTTCTSNLCNILTPSFSCYSTGVGAGNNESVISCPAGVTQCFSMMIANLDYSLYNGQSYYSGCGSCNATKYPSCVTCNASLCNSFTPSSRSCYYRFLSSTSTINGLPTQCPNGITSCYSYTASAVIYSTINYAGCGTCSSDAIPSCVTCSSDFCNTELPSSISCRSWEYSTYSLAACATGVSKCFTATAYRVGSGYMIDGYLQYADSYGCGDCTPSTTSLYGCTSCNTSNCNSIINSPGQPTTPFPTNKQTNALLSNAPGQATTQNPNNLLTNAPGQTTAKYDVATKADINCYYSFGVSSRTKISSCSSKSCFEYSFVFAFTNLFFSGCGNCTFDSGTNCRTCYTDFCNSGTTLGATGMAIAVAAASMRALMKLLD